MSFTPHSGTTAAALLFRGQTQEEVPVSVRAERKHNLVLTTWLRTISFIACQLSSV